MTIAMGKKRSAGPGAVKCGGVWGLCPKRESMEEGLGVMELKRSIEPEK